MVGILVLEESKIYKIARFALVVGIVGELVENARVFETSNRLLDHADKKTEALRATNVALDLEAQIAPPQFES